MPMQILILLGLFGIGMCGVPLGGYGLGYGGGYGLYGYRPFLNPGHGYGHGHLRLPLYNDQSPWKPIFPIKKPVFIAPVYKPIVPLYKPSHFSITPSLSYGYSYKLVPTYAYGPDHAHGHGLGHGAGLGYGNLHGHGVYEKPVLH